jgi:phenylpropionate dioxygenase-like ring-hydroxylating dioxygenase large terminal subunit
VQQEVPNLSTPAYHCEARYGYAWVALEEPLAPILDAEEEHDPSYRRIPQFYEVWNTSAFRLMENSFDNAHFAFVHKGTFGQLNQPLPEKYEIKETDYGFEAETLITVANPPVQYRIAGTTEPTTKRHMRNKWYMPFCRKLDIEYPSGLRHIIFNSATPIDDDKIMVVQWLYRNDTEADCSAKELIDWDFKITREDKDIIESTDYDVPLDLGRRVEAHMVSDRPGMLMRKRLLKLFEEHGEAEVYAPRNAGAAAVSAIAAE